MNRQITGPTTRGGWNPSRLAAAARRRAEEAYDTGMRISGWDAALHRLGDLAAGRVLVVGCGSGELACHAAGRGGVVVSVTATESSDRLRDRARRRAVGEGLSITFHSHEPDALRYPAGAFDTVLCAGTLGSLSRVDQVDALREMVRVGQGRLLMLEPYVDDGTDWKGRHLGRLFDKQHALRPETFRSAGLVEHELFRTVGGAFAALEVLRSGRARQ